jgi:hypothetical protein
LLVYLLGLGCQDSVFLDYIHSRVRSFSTFFSLLYFCFCFLFCSCFCPGVLPGFARVKQLLQPLFLLVIPFLWFWQVSFVLDNG